MLNDFFEQFDIWRFLAGLGIFIFGMNSLEDAIKQLSARSLKKVIRKSTKGLFRSIFTGMSSTVILQSSSAISLMTITFVGAGMMSLRNAIGLILGTNIGTTITGWIVATLGFKLNIEGIALPLIGIGGLGMIILNKSSNYISINRLLVGLGFIFIGIDFMKGSFEHFTESFDLALIPHYGSLFYVLIGVLVTAIMQSSSATIAIVLTALNTNVLNFNEGAYLVIGANIGTTITVLFGAINGVVVKKQVAFSHLIFNVITGIIAYLLLPIFIFLIKWITNGHHDYLTNLVLFHTIFNVVGVLFFIPFIPQLVRMLDKWFPQKDHQLTKYLHKVSFDLPEACINALKLETRHLFIQTIKNIQSTFDKSKTGEITKCLLDDDLKELQNQITLFGANIKLGEIENNEKLKVHEMMSISIQLSNVSKTFWAIKSDFSNLKYSSSDIVIQKINDSIKPLLEFYQVIGHESFLNALTLEEIQLLKKQIEGYNEVFINSITELIDSDKLDNKHASSLLMFNGTMTQINRQLTYIMSLWV